eukprot:scaffold94107_cov33-Phaeocystis_antarctica.AAC.1
MEVLQQILPSYDHARCPHAPTAHPNRNPNPNPNQAAPRTSGRLTLTLTLTPTLTRRPHAPTVG